MLQAEEEEEEEEPCSRLLRALAEEFQRLRLENRVLARELEQARKPTARWSCLKPADFIRPCDDPCTGSQERPQHAELRLRDPVEEEEHVVTTVLAHEFRHRSTLSMTAYLSDQDDQGTNTATSSSMVLKSKSSKSMPSATEDHYEKIYDLTRAFHNLCASHKATIGDYELVQMKFNQAGIDENDNAVQRLRPLFAAAIRALNKELGIVVVSHSIVQPAKEINLDTFIAVVQRRELKSAEFLAEASDDVLEAISQIRDILVREDALRKIAKATNMTHQDFYRASKNRLQRTRMQKLMKYLDPIIGMVIIMNAAIIGVSTDYMQDSDIWKVSEIIFTAIFIVEIALKLVSQGLRMYCLGPDKYWNLFDALVAVIAIFDMVFTLLGAMTNLRNFTIIRLLRFARLTKLVRVLKLKAFKELALIVNGIFAGFRTLVWAIVFLGFLLFALGVMLTQTVGHTDELHWAEVCLGVEVPKHRRACTSSAEHIRDVRNELFGSVSRSMFTVFRCFTDGCSSVDGTPLVPYFYNTYGFVVIILYSIVTLFVIFGLFNLIMAVFVENTIENARVDDTKRREARESEALRVAKKLQDIIVLFCTGGAGPDYDHECEDSQDLRLCRPRSKMWGVWNMLSTGAGGSGGHFGFDDEMALMSNLSIQVTHAAFTKMLQKPEVQELLEDLEIGANSRQNLFEVLDANGNGTLEVSELVQGLLKLRGVADKGDLVAALLAIKSVQKSMRAIELLNLHQQEVIDAIKRNQESSMQMAQHEQDQNHLVWTGEGSLNLGTRSGALRACEHPMDKHASTSSSDVPPSHVAGLNAMRADHERRVQKRSSLHSTAGTTGAQP